MGHAAPQERAHRSSAYLQLSRQLIGTKNKLEMNERRVARTERRTSKSNWGLQSKHRLCSHGLWKRSQLSVCRSESGQRKCQSYALDATLPATGPFATGSPLKLMPGTARDWSVGKSTALAVDDCSTTAKTLTVTVRRRWPAWDSDAATKHIKGSAERKICKWTYIMQEVHAACMERIKNVHRGQ
ncbi:hypothetical protein CYLTODRAFT_146776 [Cylindrobasidium torrendii FP15055 ss-10]|uniref:Uncharacterized protein n=1 Tax=Cylindrobasidium torrendii FP15055 ss-10 TaxID=1314674 RepID=A0A0D7AZ75_9AGAR|nr:hypothetical protein CYLTODRAFT_146776 [Cylindrobasidium torrendii FP15055 ss-10]